jgi:hypothetical protein
MRWQTTAILAVILVALGAFYYVYEVRLGPEREKAESRKGRVWTAEAADVTRVTLERPDDTIRLEREGEGWQMLEPVKARADRGQVDEMVNALVTTRSDREIASNPPSVADFGLDKPAAKVTLTLKDGKQLGLTLGGKNPTGVWVYAREKDATSVIAVGDSVLRDATRPVADLRDKTVLAFDRKDVTGVEIATRDDTVVVESSDGTWAITSPVKLPADGDTVGDFLDKLQSSKVKAFMAESPSSLAPYGLDKPVRVAVHTGKDKDRATKTLLVGSVDKEKQGVYAMRPGETSVLLLPEDVWTALPKHVAALRDKTVVAFERDKVNRIEIESPKGAVTLAKQDTTWRITAPEALPADQVEAGAVLFKLRELKAQGFLSEDASGIPRFLGRPEVKVTIAEEGAPGPKTVLLAPSTEKRGGQPSAYAAVAGRGPVVLVDGKAVAELSRSVDDLRDHTLVSNVQPKDVKRLRVRSGGQTAVLERSGDTDWKMLEPTKAAAQSTKVEDILYAVRALKWKEVVAPRGEDPARYGLDAPSAEITLLKGDGGELATVQVGKREGDRVYLRTKASPTIYAADARMLELPKIPDDLKS